MNNAKTLFTNLIQYLAIKVISFYQMIRLTNFRFRPSKAYLILLIALISSQSFAQRLYVPVGGGEAKGIDWIKNSNNQNIRIGTSNPTRDLHIQSTSSGITTPYNLTGGLDIESNSITGINILSPNSGYGRIYFGAPSSATAGALEYIHSSTHVPGFWKQQPS